MANASEVLRDALGHMEERERRLVSLDAAIARGIADIDAGRVHDLDEVCDEWVGIRQAAEGSAGCG